MEAVRAAIENQVLSLTGLALGGVDFENPPGDPGLFGPQSVIWQVHRDFTPMLCGGVSALLLQMLHPLALAGVWEHSNFREDMIGRLRRTSQFVSVTTFGPTAEAQRLIAKVKAIHLRVTGVGSDGTPYAASDPALLTWVHVAESSRFLASHLRYRNPHLSRDLQDQYYREAARVAAALGATAIPQSCAEVEEYLQAMRPQLVCDERTQEVARILAPPRRGGDAGGHRSVTRLGAAAVRFSSGCAAAAAGANGRRRFGQGAGRVDAQRFLSACGAAHHSAIMSRSRYN